MARRPASPEVAATTALEGLGIAELALRSPAARAVIAADPDRREELRDLIGRLFAQAGLILGEET